QDSNLFTSVQTVREKRVVNARKMHGVHHQQGDSARASQPDPDLHESAASLTQHKVEIAFSNARKTSPCRQRQVHPRMSSERKRGKGDISVWELCARRKRIGWSAHRPPPL